MVHATQEEEEEDLAKHLGGTVLLYIDQLKRHVLGLLVQLHEFPCGSCLICLHIVSFSVL